MVIPKPRGIQVQFMPDVLLDTISASNKLLQLWRHKEKDDAATDLKAKEAAEALIVLIMFGSPANLSRVRCYKSSRWHWVAEASTHGLRSLPDRMHRLGLFPQEILT